MTAEKDLVLVIRYRNETTMCGSWGSIGLKTTILQALVR